MASSFQLSIVVAARNDNYGGDFNQRLSRSILWNASLLEEWQITTEYVVVNWNPDKNKPTLQSVISWPLNRKYVQFRIIEVSEALHKKQVERNSLKPANVLEFIAKNVGIRRARGHAILCTNADVQLSVDVIRYIAEKPLQDQVLYRAIRLDIDQNSKREPKRCITRWFLQGSTIRTPRYWPYVVQHVYAHQLAALKRFYYKNAPDWYYVPSISRAEKVLFDYPFNASGDFALMTKSSWAKMGGYREACIISTHVDSLHLVDCLRRDIRIELLTGTYVYHQEHTRRYSFDSPSNEMLFMYNLLCNTITSYIMGEARDKILEDQDEWGMSDEQLESVYV